MPPPPPSSNIRAFVQWKEASVYAGEEIECIITFKNVARPPGEREEELSTSNGGSHTRRSSVILPSAPHSRKSSAAHIRPPPPSLSRQHSVTSGKGIAPSRGHRPALSLNVVSSPSRLGSPQTAPLQHNVAPYSARPGKSHVRSLSIMSLVSEPASEGRSPVTPQAIGKRPSNAHSRSASLQHTPKLMANSPAALTLPPARQPSPLYESTTPPALPEGHAIPIRPARRRPGVASADNTPHMARQPSLKKKAGFDGHNFKFPPESGDNRTASGGLEPGPKPVRSPSTMHSGGKRSHSPRPQEGPLNNLNPITRVMSETSQDGTPRTSSEFYSLSNNSDETLTSEIPFHQQLGRLIPKISHSRNPSYSPQVQSAEPETLMMAYAQTVGHFTLDGSLVNSAPFEEVKRRGVQGGGGVIGVERSKRSSGLFGALSWGNIGESLNGLLGGDEMSSMAQMKASAGSKTVPLLSTPQTLLFVDLRLAPGESKSYSYRFPLPRGLPPSHRGRAIKVSYHLSLGVQRPAGQIVKSVDAPFRVLGSYDSRGDVLGHDLMSPYVLLQDAARTTTITTDPVSPNRLPRFASKQDAKTKTTPRQGLEDFLRYTERLLDSRKDANGVIVSPISPSSPDSLHNALSRQGSLIGQGPVNTREAIDFAIMRSNQALGGGSQSESQSVNRFNIARSGQPVAVLTVLRPAYRLGESVIGTIDLTAPLPDSESLSPATTYSVLVELESAEHVDPSLALRSSHSINRVTRKVYASVRENALFARQISFSLAIPWNAAPSFETTGVSLAWRLKVEFMTQRSVRGLGIERSGQSEDLLEEIVADERGTTLIARERLPADTFEMSVPLKVYGAVGITSATAENAALLV